MPTRTSVPYSPSISWETVRASGELTRLVSSASFRGKVKGYSALDLGKELSSAPTELVIRLEKVGRMR